MTIENLEAEFMTLPRESQAALLLRLLKHLGQSSDLGSKPSGRSRWDISVYNRENQLILIVEVKRRSNPSLPWVLELGWKIFESENFPKSPYMMLVFTDSIYLWSNLNHQKQIAEPSYIIDATPIFQPYFERAGVTADQINPQSFEMIVTSWLREIIHSQTFGKESDKSQQWLVESGLGTAIAGGFFQYEDIA